MAKFKQSVLIDAPVDRVFSFHERPDALNLLSPAFPPVKMLSSTGGIKEGAIVELRIGPIPWTAKHTGYQKNQLFVDEQIRGPFALWVHRHEFRMEGSGTRLTDSIEFLLPGGRLVNGLFSWVMSLNLRLMFRHRHSVTKYFCEIPSLEA